MALRNLYSVPKHSEGGKGGKGKGGAKGKGQVVVITQDDDAHDKLGNLAESSSSSPPSTMKFTAADRYSPVPVALSNSSVLVRIDLTRIDLRRLDVPEKVKVKEPPNGRITYQVNTSCFKISRIFLKISSIFKEQDENSNSRWRNDQSSSSSSCDQHANYNLDQPKDNYFHSQLMYHSPTSLDAKLDGKARKFKAEFKEHNNNSLPPSEETKLQFANGMNGAANLSNGKTSFPSRIKEESSQQENRKKRSASSNSNTYKEKKRKKVETLEESQPTHQATNHDRLQIDAEPKELLNVKRVFVSYFERSINDIELATMFV